VSLDFFEDNYRAIKSLARVPVVAEGYPHIYHCWEYLVWRNYQESIDINLNFFEQLQQQQPQIMPRIGKNLALLYHLIFPFQRHESLMVKRNQTAQAWLDWPESRNDPARAEIEQVCRILIL